MEVLLSEKQIQQYIYEMASMTNHSNDKPDVIICALSGAVFFFNDLIKQLDFDFEIDFIKPTSFDSTGQRYYQTQIIGPFGGISLEGKKVMVVEDIIDSGRTLNSIVNHLRGMGCSDIWVKSLLLRKSLDIATLPCRVSYCFEVESDDWLIGYGLDDNQKKRNLKDIYVKK